jgi:RimJ/RimL family protein N-acetyltransferase
MLKIETARLTLRPFTPNDLNDLYEIRSDPEVMRYIGSGKPESIEQVRTVLSKILAHWEQHGFGRWAAIDKESEKLFGWCGLSYLENTEDVEIGYGIAKSYWGKGLTSEAAAAAIKWGFEDLGLDHIVAVAWPDNIVSRRVMDRLGMKYVKMGYHYRAEVVYYAIYREEYQAASRTKSAARPPSWRD